MSAEYKLVLTKACEAERTFMNSLEENQRKEYLKLESMFAELDVVGENEFAEYLFENIRKHF
jgi:hypothetical protein